MAAARKAAVRSVSRATKPNNMTRPVNGSSGFAVSGNGSASLPLNDVVQNGNGGGLRLPAGANNIRDLAIRALEEVYEEAKMARWPHQAIWEESWNLYNNDWNFTDKEPWQSQRKLPTVTMTVERLAAIFTRILSTSNNWIMIKARMRKKQKWVNVIKALLLYWFNHQNVQFFRFFSQSIKCGLLSQVMSCLVTGEIEGIEASGTSAGPAPTTPEGEAAPSSVFSGGSSTKSGPINPSPKWCLKLDLLNPTHVYLDPTGRDRYKIVERSYTKGEFLAEAEARGWINIDLVMQTNMSQPDMHTYDARKMHEPTSAFSHDLVYIREIYGDLYDPTTGMRLWKNQHFVVAQKVIPVQPPRDNPFWHGKCPIVTAGLLDVPFSVYQKSLIGISLDAFKLWVEFLNLVIDYFTTLFLGQTEVNMSNLHPDEDIDQETGAPGRVWKKRSGEPLITYTQMGEPSQQVWQFLPTIKTEIQEGSALIDAMAGSPKSRGKVTGMEFDRRMAEGGALIDFVFQMLEEQYIRPIVERAFHTILQFMPQDEWALWVEERQEDFPDIAADLDELKAMTPEQRFAELGNAFQFETKVFSAIFDRQQEIEKITFLMNVIGKIPQASQYMKWDQLLGKLVEAFGWDPEELLAEHPIVPMSDQDGGGQPVQPNGTQPGVGVDAAEQPPEGNETAGQASSFLTGGSPPPGMMPGSVRSGNPQVGGSGG